MRTTVNIADDMFILAQQTAQRERISLGEAITQWMRRGASTGCAPTLAQGRSNYRSPFGLIPADGHVVTSEDVYRLMEQEGI